MSPLQLQVWSGNKCLGLKGPRATEWLAIHGIATPPVANTWTSAGSDGDAQELLVARLGTAELFLRDHAAGQTVDRLRIALRETPPGVYPVLREDTELLLSGGAARDVLAQVCNVDFSRYPSCDFKVVMTLFIGVAVLVVPQSTGAEQRFRIWCDPSFGAYLSESLGVVVVESGGSFRRYSDESRAS